MRRPIGPGKCKPTLWLKKTDLAAWFHLLRLTTNATISCKILVKIEPVVLAENRLTNGTCVCVNATGISYDGVISNISQCQIALSCAIARGRSRRLVRHCLFNIYFFVSYVQLEQQNILRPLLSVAKRHGRWSSDVIFRCMFN